jgi:hypothetical protein
MTDPRYLQELKKYGSGEPTEADIEALEAELYDGPDRGAAVVLGSLVERALERLLWNNMRKEGISELFKYGAPLGDFGSKVQIAYAFKLFGAETRKDLNIIRNLRNQFAHSRMPIAFTTPVVQACCDELVYPDAPGVTLSFKMINTVSEQRFEQASDKHHPRTRYFTSCNEIAQRIYFIRGGDNVLPINQLL